MDGSLSLPRPICAGPGVGHRQHDRRRAHGAAAQAVPDLGHGAELRDRASSGWRTASRASARPRRWAVRAGARRASRASRPRSTPIWRPRSSAAARTHRSRRAGMDPAAKRNNAAKGAIETALLDASEDAGHARDHAARRRRARPHSRAVDAGLRRPGAGDRGGRRKLAARLHRTFKVKIGALEPAADMARMRHLAQALERPGASSSSMPTRPGTKRSSDPLPAATGRDGRAPGGATGAGLEHRRDGPAAARPGPLRCWPMNACSPRTTCWPSARPAAADAVSLKMVKHGGLLGVATSPRSPRRPGIGLYGGCLLESSVGAAAHLQAFATLRDTGMGLRAFRAADPGRRPGDGAVALRGLPHPSAGRARHRRHAGPGQVRAYARA